MIQLEITTYLQINYIFAPDGLIAIYENKNGTGKMYYTTTENLGFLFRPSGLEAKKRKPLKICLL